MRINVRSKVIFIALLEYTKGESENSYLWLQKLRITKMITNMPHFLTISCGAIYHMTSHDR